MPDMLKKVPDDLIQNVNVDKLAQYYKTTPTAAHVIENSWLQKVTILAICFLVGLIGLLLMVLRFGCEQCNTWAMLGHLLAENAAVFIFVGGIEVCFFLFIAKNYVPVRPSYMMEQILADVQKVFQ